MDIAAAVSYARPGEQWILVEYEYEGLEWLDTTEKPTIKELEIAWNNLQQDKENEKKKKEDDLASALSKLKLLGLTEDEAKAIIGI